MPSWTAFETAIICELRSNDFHDITNDQIGFYLDRSGLAAQVHYTRTVRPARENPSHTWTEPRLPREWQFNTHATLAKWQLAHPDGKSGDYPCHTDESDDAAYERELTRPNSSPQLTISPTRCLAAYTRLNAREGCVAVPMLPVMQRWGLDQPVPPSLMLHQIPATFFATLPLPLFTHAKAIDLQHMSEDQINAMTVNQIKQLQRSELTKINHYTMLWRLTHDLKPYVQRKVVEGAQAAFQSIPQPNFDPIYIDPITVSKAQEVFLDKQRSVFFRLPIKGDSIAHNALALDQDTVDTFLNDIYPRIAPGRPTEEENSGKIWDVYGRHMDSTGLSNAPDAMIIVATSGILNPLVEARIALAIQVARGELLSDVTEEYAKSSLAHVRPTMTPEDRNKRSKRMKYR